MAMPKLSDYLLENPLYSYGQKAGQQGMQTTPVQSWQEGLARMLQGGLGGLSAAVGMSNAKEEQNLDQKALASAMQLYSTDSAGARAALASRPNLSETAAALMMQDAGLQKQIDFEKAKQKIEREGQREDAAMWGFGPGASSGGGGGGAAPTVGGVGTPQGFQNNIGNIRTSGAAWPGKGEPYKGFETFATPEAGAGAMFSNLQAYIKQNPGVTVAQAIAKWAPPNENATGAYIQRVAEETGINPGLPLAEVVKNPVDAARIMTAMGSVEKGGIPKGFTPDTFVQAATPGFAPPPQAPQGVAAPGQPGPVAAPPTSETINFQGIEIPRAALAGAFQITDRKERQKRISEIVNDALKFQREGAPVERVRQPDGTEKIVPRPQAAGMVAAQNVGPPGTKEGDVDVLMTGDPSTPEYAAAYDRQAMPQQSSTGQLMYPPMDAYRKPERGAGRVKIEDTPASRFKMSGDLANDFNQLKPVKDYREVVPIFQSMQETAGRNDRVSDLNLVYGLAKLMDPTSVVREGEQIMVRNAQGLPDWLRGMINGANGGSTFVPEQRARIMREAESRVNAYKGQYDGIAQQFKDRAERHGLDWRDVLTTPTASAPSAPQAAPAPATRRFNPQTGRIE
ncbi:hypothetical protein UFOVP833_50 [uncultured Caudovirales phage]|uniref:Uncharacterized protein n=1 Tax=uncultured Caudovirales phage TaxID=2100421 RepID=A0A6J5P093_9CAUD|nr:hypothetical protein UFOVP833_50 [uncultured Caudovirales phage]CAB4218539.1 hypothetical protein UFOVP1603_38 [uncultured Caudovirales phage]